MNWRRVRRIALGIGSLLALCKGVDYAFKFQMWQQTLMFVLSIYLSIEGKYYDLQDRLELLEDKQDGV